MFALLYYKKQAAGNTFPQPGQTYTATNPGCCKNVIFLPGHNKTHGLCRVSFDAHVYQQEK